MRATDSPKCSIGAKRGSGRRVVAVMRFDLAHNGIHRYAFAIDWEELVDFATRDHLRVAAQLANRSSAHPPQACSVFPKRRHELSNN
jgi:hypothetical protein